MHIDFPLSITRHGRTAATTRDDHIRDLLEQVLFTGRGERVNRPDFGAGVERLVFAPNSDELASATKAIVQGALQQFLADVIVVNGVSTRADDAALEITIDYSDLETGERRATTLSGGL